MKPFWTMKKTLNLCAMVGLWSLLTLPVFGQGTENVITWGSEELEDGTLAVYYQSGTLSQTIEVPSTIDGKTVSTIRASAFEGKAILSGIIIPDSVTNIDDKAFSGCSQLSELVLGNGLVRIGESAFKDCSSLGEVALPKSLEYIGDHAFEGCAGLTLKGSIPGSVTYIGDSAFKGCNSFQDKLTLPDGLEAIGAHAFENCDGISSIELPASLAVIGEAAFKGCDSLSSIKGGSGLVEIGASAFENCSSLEQWPSITPKPPHPILNIAGSAPDLENIGDKAFKNCTTLDTLWIGDSVTNIGAEAFAKCSTLWTNILGQSVVTIGEGAFRETALKRLEIPNSVVYMGAAVCSNCTSLTRVHLGNSVEFLGNNAFRSCGVLMAINIPDSLQNIEYQTFYGCTGLLDLNIGNSITNIGPEACRSCASLTNMVISGQVRNVDIRAFFECIQLRDVYLGKTVETVGIEAFAFCPALMNITVDSRNTHFVSRDGILFDRKVPTTLVTMPNGRKGEYTVPKDVAYIGPYAFSYCTYLTGITLLPGKLKGIKEGAFYRCINLLKMDVPDSVTEIGAGAFDNCTALKSVSTGNGVTELCGWLFYGCTALTNAVVGQNVTYIGSNAFNHCTSLSQLTLPDGLRQIDYKGFFDCMKLTSFRIPPALESLGAYALGHCYGLTTVTIPASVKEVGDYAFYQCRDMQSIYFEGNAPVTDTYSFLLDDAICVAYVRPGSTGWGVEIPGTWGYIPIDYYGDLMGEGSASVSAVMVTADSTNSVALSADAAYYLDMWPVTPTAAGQISVGEVADPELANDGTLRAPHLISVREAAEGAQLPGVAEVRGADGETVPAAVVFTPTSGSVEIRTTKDGQPEEGVSVWIDTAVEPLGVTPLTVTNLAAAKHVLLLKKEGFLRPRPVEFTVTAGSTLSIEIPLATDDQPAMEINVQSALPDVNIYVDYLPTGEKTPNVVGGMDPGFYDGEGWTSASHSILLRHELLTPYAPRKVPEWRTNPSTGEPVIPEEPVVITIDAPNDFLDSDGDGMTNIHEVEIGFDPFVSDINILSAKATNGETVTIQAQAEQHYVEFSSMSGGEKEGTLQVYVVGDVGGSEGSVVESGLYLVMKRAMVGEGSDELFAHPCVVEVFSPIAVLVTWEIPDEEGPFFVLGLCDETEAKALNGMKVGILHIQSDDYLAEIVLDEINVGLTERNEGETAPRQIPPENPLLTKLVPEGESFTLGKAYMEELAVVNNGAINEYVRVTVYKYWMKDGEKAVDLDPSQINLHFVTGAWVIDEDASTVERTVLYYNGGAVAPGDSTPIFADTLTVGTAALSAHYAGATFHIACVVEGVQNHTM